MNDLDDYEAENIDAHCNCCAWLFDVLTNYVPLLISLYLLGNVYLLMGTVAVSILIGLFSVMVAATVYIRANKNRSHESEESVDQNDMRPRLDKMSWMLVAAVLLPSAVIEISEAFRPHSHIRWLTDRGFKFPFGTVFNALDVFALAFAVIIIFSPFLAIWISNAAKKIAKTVSKWRSTVTAAKVVDKTQNSPSGLNNAYVFTFGTLIVLALTIWLAVVFFTDAEDVHSHESTSVAPPRLGFFHLALSAFGIGLFLVGYLSHRRTLFDLSCHSDRVSDDDTLLWVRTLKILTFEAVVIPPVVGAAALVSRTLDSASVVVYGLFIFSGFSVWNLSIKVITGRPGKERWGVFAVVVQLCYSFLMTVLWSIVFFELKEMVGNDLIFDAVLRVSLASVFVQLVFGPVYRNAWGNNLGDRWLSESAEYGVVATVACLGLGAIPASNPFKLVAMVGVFAILMAAPAIILRRNMTAYVLIRVKPGKTRAVRRRLVAEEIACAVVYGDHDIIAKVELAGGSSFLGSRAEVDSRNLYLLAAVIKKKLRAGDDGVVETQTLLDFSNSVPLENQSSVRDDKGD